MSPRYPRRMAAPSYATVPRIPGRNSGFTLGIVALFSCLVPLLCVPLGAIGLVQSLRAKRRVERGKLGYGVVVAALVLNSAALAVTLTLVLLATIRTYA
jgi:hypothetical protein